MDLNKNMYKKQALENNTNCKTNGLKIYLSL